MNMVYRIIFLAAISIAVAQAEDPAISTFQGNGKLTWTSAPGTQAYTIEWASSLEGPWRREWTGLDSIISADRTHTVDVPMFYRVVQGFTADGFRGPWIGIMTENGETQHDYLLPDGDRTITDMSLFHPYVPMGTYLVEPQGAIFITLFEKDHPTGIVITGQFANAHSILCEPVDGVEELMYRKVENPARCAGSWSGELNADGGSLYQISFQVDETGLVSNFSGLPAHVTGRLFALESGEAVAFFRTGAADNDPYNQVRIHAVLSGDHLAGRYEGDSNDCFGTVTLTRP